MAAAGVPVGANTPNQLSPSNCVDPVSLIVGTSGTAVLRAADDRERLEQARLHVRLGGREIVEQDVDAAADQVLLGGRRAL